METRPGRGLSHKPSKPPAVTNHVNDSSFTRQGNQGQIEGDKKTFIKIGNWKDWLNCAQEPFSTQCGAFYHHGKGWISDSGSSSFQKACSGAVFSSKIHAWFPLTFSCKMFPLVRKFFWNNGRYNPVIEK